MLAIITTRPLGAADPLSRRLGELGYRVHAVPTVLTEPCANTSALDQAARRLATFDWVVLTSATGVRILFDRLGALGIACPKEPRPRWAAVGPATAEALRGHGIQPAAQPDAAHGAAIVGAVERLGSLRGRRFLLARADGASHELPSLLTHAGAVVEDCRTYRTVVGPEASRLPLKAALEDPELRAVVFASGSAVHGFLRLAGTEATNGRRIPAVSIGPQTTRVVRRLGFTVLAEASTPGVDGLADAILAALPPPQANIETKR